VDLLLPGDAFACQRNRQNFSVEAAAEVTTIVCYPRRKVEALVISNPRVGWLLAEIATQTICRLQSQLLIVGRITALEKIGAFLVALAERQAGTGKAADRVNLPISRYDIADYLALSVETVSRSLTGLKERGLISFTTTRAIKIIDRHALENCGDSRLRGPRFEHHPSHLSDGARLAMTARRIASASL
jgi:CRP-like cAMP-binding protein